MSADALRCAALDRNLGRCILDAGHEPGDIHAWERVPGPPGPWQQWQIAELRDQSAPDAVPAERPCSTPCDADCPEPCHEIHLSAWKRDHQPRECALLAEVERLTRERDALEAAHENAGRWCDRLNKRAESAKAEVATLRATLQRIEDLAGYYDRECADDGVAIPSVLPLSVARRLRAALRNKP